MSDDNLAWLDTILKKNGASIAKAHEFVALRAYDILLILDDSTSMRSKSGSSTRWCELLETARQIIDIACCFDTDGIDVYFLNQGKLSNVTSGADAGLVRRFARGPNGGTPLTETLQKALSEHSGEKPLLVLILTDGQPNGGVSKFSKVLEDSIQRARGRIRYQLMACTSDDNAVSWMDDLDVKYSEVDATDDFHTEQAQVLKAGFFKKFERGDWVAKALLGAITKKWNCLDDRAHVTEDDESTTASSSADGRQSTKSSSPGALRPTTHTSQPQCTCNVM
jgi:hypothetical protein